MSDYTPVLFNVFEDWNEESVVPHISFDLIRIRFERKRPIRRFLIYLSRCTAEDDAITSALMPFISN